MCSVLVQLSIISFTVTFIYVAYPLLPGFNILRTDNNSNSLQFLHAFLLSADCFTKLAFSKNLSGIPSECQTVVGPDQETT